MQQSIATEPTFYVTSDGPAIDFANSVEWHAADVPVEHLTSYERLVAWAEAAGLLDPSTATPFLAFAATHPQRAAEALTRAIELREALYRIYAAISRADHAPADALATLNAFLPEVLTRLQITNTTSPGRFDWCWTPSDDPLAFLAPVVRDAVELLASPDVTRIRECAGHPCGWIFLDHSRNHSRRWCSMAGCGNRAKARRHYQRARGRVPSDR